MSGSQILIIQKRTVLDVSSSEIQDALNKCPDCVIVQGSIDDFYNRIEELGIIVFRGSGLAFGGNNVSFKSNFNARRIEVDGNPFVMFYSLYKFSAYGYKPKVSEEEVAKYIRQSGMSSKDEIGKQEEEEEEEEAQQVCLLVEDRTVYNVTSAELQAKLVQCPDCVVVSGDKEAFSERLDELDIMRYRGSGLGFEGRDAVFKTNFSFRGLVVMGHPFTIFFSLHKMSAIMYNPPVSDKMVEAFIRKYLSSSPSPSSQPASEASKAAAAVTKSSSSSLPKVVLIFDHNTTASIKMDDLQRLMQKSPDCVIVYGTQGIFAKRAAEEHVTKFDDGTYGFRGKTIIFHDTFKLQEFMLDDFVFTRFGKSNGKDSFAVEVSQEELAAALRMKGLPAKADFSGLPANLPEAIQVLHKQIGVITDRNISNISSEELQSVMARFPDRVVLPGSCKVFEDRFQEMNIDRYRGSGWGFRGSKIFPEPFRIENFMIENMTFLQLGKGSNFSFKTDVDNKGVVVLTAYCMKFPANGITASKSKRSRDGMDVDDDDSQRVVQAKDLHKTVTKKIRELLQEKIKKEHELLVDNDGMVPNRATKFAFGTIMEVLTSLQNGMNLVGHATVKGVETWEFNKIKLKVELDSLRSAGHIFYCRKWVGVENLPGSDGQCGPTNGPHCKECDARQKNIADRQLLLVNIVCESNTSTTIRLQCVDA